MAVKVYPFDASEYLDDAESQAELIADALSTGNAGHVAHAIGVVARARGMTQVAHDAGLSRESLYKALRLDGNPELATILQVAKALGVTLSASSDKAAA